MYTTENGTVTGEDIKANKEIFVVGFRKNVAHTAPCIVVDGCYREFREDGLPLISISYGKQLDWVMYNNPLSYVLEHEGEPKSFRYGGKVIDHGIEYINLLV